MAADVSAICTRGDSAGYRARRRVRLATTRRAWERWQAAAGRWQGWTICPALLAPETADISPVATARPAAAAIVERLQHSLAVGGTALILDLEPILAVNLAAGLNQLGLANGVLVLPRWPYRQAILPVAGLLDCLVRQAAWLTAGDLPNVAFVLDGERSRAVTHRGASDQRADNRYRLTVGDLPNLTALRARGITRVVKLSVA